MYSRPAQFLLWTLLYGAGALLTLFVLRRKRSDFALRDLPLRYGSVMVVLWAVHPLIFRVPNNYASMQRSGMFGYWFSTRRALDFDLEWSFIVASAVFAFGLALVLGFVYCWSRTRHVRHTLACWSFPFWYLAAQCLTVPGRELISFSHFAMIEGLGDVPKLLLEEPRAAGAMLTPLVLGMVSLGVAITLNLWGSSVEPVPDPDLAD